MAITRQPVDIFGTLAVPITLTANAVYGAWFPVGDASQIQLLVHKTTANNPTDVMLAIQLSYDAGVTVYDPTQIDQVVLGGEYRSSRILHVTDFTAAEDNREVLVEGIAQGGGNMWVRFGAYGVAPFPDLYVSAVPIEAS